MGLLLLIWSVLIVRRGCPFGCFINPNTPFISLILLVLLYFPWGYKGDVLKRQARLWGEVPFRCPFVSIEENNGQNKNLAFW